MANMKKWLFMSFMTIALVFLSFANTVHIAFAEGKTATLAIVGDSQKGIMLCPKEVAIQDGETAYSLLQKEMGSKVTAENTNYGVYVKGIDGLMAGETSGWSYEVNNKSPMVGADSYKLEAGDVVAYRFVSDWNNMSQQTLQQVLDEHGTCKKQPDTDKPGTDKPDTTKPQEPTKGDLTKQVDEAIVKTAQKMMKDGIDSDWVVIGLAQSGQEVSKEMKSNYLQSLAERIKEKDSFSSTELARTILAVSAVDGDPTNIASNNLISKLYSSEKIDSITGYIFSLLALDTKKYDVPANAKWNRDTLVNAILKSQHTDGGWAYRGKLEEPSDADVTGMVFPALAPYQDQAEVKQALEKAKQYLASTQTDKGGFTSGGVENANSVAEVVLGLAAAGIDPTSTTYTKNNYNAVQNLLSYQLENGGFKWLPTDTEADSMATEQAMLALVQYKNYLNGKGSIFDWTKASTSTNEGNNSTEEPKQPTSDNQPVTEEQQKQADKQPVVASEDQVVQKEAKVEKRSLPETGMSGLNTARPAAFGVLCIGAAYVLWRRKAA
ncbi:cell wall anchor protein [Bacillus pseudomycoides]|nr:cell wall anchor protein [Bacillus pseudomycoides]